MVSSRGKMPENGNWRAVHLSRSEVLELVFGKLHVIEEAARSASEKERPDGKFTMHDLQNAQRLLKQIAVEARRAASLIETHTHVATAGHCIHCGKTYEEHDTDEKRREERPYGLAPKGKPPNPAIDGVRCLALQRLFESAELELYQPLPTLQVDLG